jgi:hypothetical protein
MPPRPCFAQPQTGQRRTERPCRITGAGLHKHNSHGSGLQNPVCKRAAGGSRSHDHQICLARVRHGFILKAVSADDSARNEGGLSARQRG